FQPFDCTGTNCWDLEEIQTIDYWERGHPNGAGSQMCIRAYLGGSVDDALNDKDCNGNFYDTICEVDSIPKYATECLTPIAPHVCDATYEYSASGPPYPKGTTVTITCTGGTLTAECLGEPYGWYILGTWRLYSVCQGCSPPPEMPCARVNAALKSSYDHGEQVEYITFVTEQTFSGATCEDATWIVNYTIPSPGVGLPQLVQSEGKCFYVVVNVNTTWHGAEEYCQDTVNGSLAMPESQHLLTQASLIADGAGAKHLWVGPNILGADYVCSDNSADNTCRNFWNYVDGTRIPGDLFKDDQPKKDQNRLCLFIEANNQRLKNEDCYKDNKYPLCEVNAVFSPEYGRLLLGLSPWVMVPSTSWVRKSRVADSRGVYGAAPLTGAFLPKPAEWWPHRPGGFVRALWLIPVVSTGLPRTYQVNGAPTLQGWLKMPPSIRQWTVWGTSRGGVFMRLREC
ncbi:unnamed protein product, partial [Cyprideis torosa]